MIKILLPGTIVSGICFISEVWNVFTHSSSVCFDYFQIRSLSDTRTTSRNTTALWLVISWSSLYQLVINAPPVISADPLQPHWTSSHYPTRTVCIKGYYVLHLTYAKYLLGVVTSLFRQFVTLFGCLCKQTWFANY